MTSPNRLNVLCLSGLTDLNASFQYLNRSTDVFARRLRRKSWVGRIPFAYAFVAPGLILWNFFVMGWWVAGSISCCFLRMCDGKRTPGDCMRCPNFCCLCRSLA